MVVYLHHQTTTKLLNIMKTTFKFENIAVCKKNQTLGFVSGNSVAELKRIVKEDKNIKFRNHGIITICFYDRDCVNVNSNK